MRDGFLVRSINRTVSQELVLTLFNWLSENVDKTKASRFTKKVVMLVDATLANAFEVNGRLKEWKEAARKAENLPPSPFEGKQDKFLAASNPERIDQVYASRTPSVLGDLTGPRAVTCLTTNKRYCSERSLAW